MKILVLNCGSSSLKYQLIQMEDESVLAKGLCERIGIEGSKLVHTPEGKDKHVVEQDMKDHTDAVKMVLDMLVDKEQGVIANISEIDAVGHRVVHGGEKFTSSALITAEVKKTLAECSELAPLHNPPNLIGIDACEKLMPSVKQVAVFDTAFHQTMPKKAYMYALPHKFYEKYGIRRYGFHGTSHLYVTGRAADILNKPIESLKLVTCHLGNGGSVCAVLGGKSIDTSMGFTPLEGLVMGTRSGDIDPAIIKYLIEKDGLTIADIDRILNKESGVLGLSEVSSDFRDLGEAADKGDEKAQIALDVFHYRVAKYIGAYAAAMNGIDAVIFTAGLGENGAESREAICEYLGYLGLTIDKEKNKQRGVEFDFATADSKIRALTIPTNEELVIARDTKVIIS